ncbi:hypothetical protein ACLSYY_04515 [[Pasteurella] aerogenes]
MCINLLPWRLYQHQAKRKTFLFALVMVLLLTLFIFGWLFYQNEQLQQQRHQKQEDLNQLHQNLTHLQQDIAQFRQRYQPNAKVTSFSTPSVLHLLEHLAQLPLKQGELQQLKLAEHQLVISGKAENAAEFEGLQQYLKQHVFAGVKLTQFNPTQTQIFFEFQLPLEEEK